MAKQVLSAFQPWIKALNSEQIKTRATLFGLLEASTILLNRQTSEFSQFSLLCGGRVNLRQFYYLGGVPV